MAVKKATSPKTVKKAATAVKKVVKKTSPKAGTKKGAKLACGVCGMVVTVDSVCGCAETHPIVCCDRPMKAKK